MQVNNAELLNFGTGFKSVISYDDSTFGIALFMLLADIFIYALIAMYLEKVFPSEAAFQ